MSFLLTIEDFYFNIAFHIIDIDKNGLRIQIYMQK